MRSPQVTLALLFVLAAGLLIVGVDGYGLWEPEELGLLERDELPPNLTFLLGFGSSRLPTALLGVGSFLVLVVTARRLANHETGILAGLVLLSMPEFVYEARTFSLGVGLGLGPLLLAGGVGATLNAATLNAATLKAATLNTTPLKAHPLNTTRSATEGDGTSPPTASANLRLVDGLLILGGAGLALIQPLGGAAVNLAGAAAIGRSQPRLAGLLTALAGAYLLVGLGGIELSWAAVVSFAPKLEPLVYGTFPFISVAPLACSQLLATRNPTDRFVASWALLAYAFSYASALFLDRPLPVALPAALVCARYLQSRSRTVAAGAALVFLVSLVLASDLRRNPGGLTGLGPAPHLFHPEQAPDELRWIPVLFGIAFAVAGAFAVRRPSRGTTGALVGLGLLFGGSIAHLWIPTVGQTASSRSLFETFLATGRTGTLLVHGLEGTALERYAPGRVQPVNASAARDAFLQPRATSLIVPRQDECTLHQAAGAHEIEYAVAAASEEHLLLLTDPAPDRPTLPSLHEMLQRHAPEDDIEPLIRFQHIDLIAVDLPTEARRGSTVEATFTYRVRSSPGRPYDVFVHFDGFGHRFHGDHPPIEGRCPTTHWRDGDYVVDRFTFSAGGVLTPPGDYRVYTGFFFGSSGNWTNMAVLDERGDADHRAFLGTLRVR